MTFKQILLASCALVISATAATAQIPSYVPTDGLVGWWPFNGNANDESGNGNDGNLLGSINYTVDRFGLDNLAISINTGGSLMATTTSFDNPQVFSISAWFKSSDVGNILFSFNNGQNLHGGNWDRALFIVENAIRFYVFNGAETFVTANGSYLDNNWHNVIVNFNDSGTQIYLDTDLIVSDATVNSAQQYSGYWRVGGLSPNDLNNSFVGNVDDIGLWNRALTPQEIQNLYNGTTETVDTGNGAAPLPQGIPYQAAARDVQGQSLVNAAVNVRFTLHEGAADGAASYAETHALTTNSVGLFNTVFGNGTPEQSAFDSINWAATTKFLQVEIDLGEGYVDMGTTQLLSVPYALRSDEAARVKNAGLPVFNDNAAALAGGLVAGEMYRTAAGVLMVAY
jgi:hypothetical protein